MSFFLFLILTPSVQAAAPTFVATGAVARNTGAITPAFPAGIAVNDILLLFLETANQAISVANPNGGIWTEVTNSPQSLGTAGSTGATRLTVFWSRYNGTQTAPVTSDSGDHQVGVMIAIRGVVSSGDPWDVTAGGVDAALNMSGAIPGTTTAIPDTFIVAAIATDLPDTNGTANFSGWANTSLTSVTERFDVSRAEGNGGGLGIATGNKATAGAYSNTTVTLAASAVKAMMSIALRPPVTTIANGTNPSNSSIAPGASATDLDSFTLQTNTGADTVTAATVTLAAGSSGGLSLVAITNDAGSTTYCSASNPASDTISLTTCGIPVTTSLTQFKIRVTPKSHANMPVTPGSTYLITGTVTSFTSTNSQSGSDTDSATVTIDNSSPANVTSASGTASDSQVSLSWTNPADSDFHSSVVLRRATTAVADTPVEGTTYTVGNTIGTATVACVVASPTASCTDSGLSNGTAYHYKIFAKDSNGNYSAIGVIPTGSPITPADTIAPGAITNLAVTSAGQTSVALSWKAPGDSGDTGTAASYDMRYSTSVITAGNFSSATQAIGEPAPSAASSSESMTVSGLSASNLYYFAIKTSDEVPNTSAISNVVSTTTTATPDTTAPGAVTNLAVSSVSTSSVSLTWTAPGDDGDSGTAASYDVRYSTSVITAGNFSSATAATGEPTPSVASSSQSMTVSGLSTSTLYYFVIKTSDEVPNTSAISNVVSTTTSAAAPGPATKFVIIDPSDSTVGTAITVTVQAQRADDSINTSYQNDVTLVASGSATGEGLVDIVNGVGTIQINDAIAETVTLSLSDTQSTGLNVNSSQQVVFSAAPAPAAPAPAAPAPSTESTPGRTLKIIFSGQAYPGAKIEVLRKDTSAEDVPYLTIPLETHLTSADGSFDLSLGALIADEYFLALRAEDKDGRKTRILPYSVDLRTTDTLEVRDILMPPTIDFEKTRIRKGDSMKIIGYSTPTNKTEIEIDGKIVSVVSPQKTGFYSFTTTTREFAFGNHYARVRQTNTKASNFSTSRTFQISQLLIPRADFNQDNVVNVTDWSIFLFRWGSKDEKVRLTTDMNADGKIDIKDFSIFLGTLNL